MILLNFFRFGESMNIVCFYLWFRLSLPIGWTFTNNFNFDERTYREFENRVRKTFWCVKIISETAYCTKSKNWSLTNKYINAGFLCSTSFECFRGFVQVDMIIWFIYEINYLRLRCLSNKYLLYIFNDKLSTFI